jgi:magnesium-transporting ATPase (P-type)
VAIGDGVYDVGMIQATDVGVGIAGVEGAQVLTIFQAI